MERNKKRLNNKGFTLVELLVVIGIIGILAVVLVPQFMKYLESAEKKAVLADARTILTASLAYATEHDGDAPTVKGDIAEFVGNQLDEADVTWNDSDDDADTDKDPDCFTYTKGKWTVTCVDGDFGDVTQASEEEEET